MMKRRSNAPVDQLARTAPFDKCPRRALRPLAPNVDRLQLPAGAVLARDHDLPRELIVVVEGSLTAVDHEGRRRTLGAGASVGGEELLTGREHHETVVADTPLEVLVVNGPAFRWAAAELFD